jgi:hypothetical protein
MKLLTLCRRSPPRVIRREYGQYTFPLCLRNNISPVCTAGNRGGPCFYYSINLGPNAILITPRPKYISAEAIAPIAAKRKPPPNAESVWSYVHIKPSWLSYTHLYRYIYTFMVCESSGGGGKKINLIRECHSHGTQKVDLKMLLRLSAAVNTPDFMPGTPTTYMPTHTHTLRLNSSAGLAFKSCVCEHEIIYEREDVILFKSRSNGCCISISQTPIFTYRVASHVGNSFIYILYIILLKT